MGVRSYARVNDQPWSLAVFRESPLTYFAQGDIGYFDTLRMSNFSRILGKLCSKKVLHGEMKSHNCCSVADTIVSQSLRRRRRGKKSNTEFKVHGKQFARHSSPRLNGALSVGISIWKVSERAPSLVSLNWRGVYWLRSSWVCAFWEATRAIMHCEVGESEYYFWVAFVQKMNGIC